MYSQVIRLSNKTLGLSGEFTEKECNKGEIFLNKDDQFLQCCKKSLLGLMSKRSLEAPQYTSFYQVAVTKGTGNRVNECM